MFDEVVLILGLFVGDYDDKVGRQLVYELGQVPGELTVPLESDQPPASDSPRATNTAQLGKSRLALFGDTERLSDASVFRGDTTSRRPD